MSVTLYHNPRCSKSSQTLELLQARGIAHEIVEYLKTPPDAATLGRILALLGLAPRELMRKNEAEYAANRLDDPSLSRDALIAAMIADPILIERPIVLAQGKAALGRPPDSALAIL